MNAINYEDLSGWKERPTLASVLPKDIQYAVFFDENGSPEVKSIDRAIKSTTIPNDKDRYFGLCAVVIKKENLSKIRESFVNLKHEYFHYLVDPLCVCLHSRDIRRSDGYFSDKCIDRTSFAMSIGKLISNSNFGIYYALIDKFFLRMKYPSYNAYQLALIFIFERICKFTLNGESAFCYLESRGKKEDKRLLKNIVDIYENGTRFAKPYQIQRIKGVYFNPKQDIELHHSYFGLELADLCAYPIYKYCVYGTRDTAFECIAPKIYGHPHYDGRGIKVMPSK